MQLDRLGPISVPLLILFALAGFFLWMGTRSILVTLRTPKHIRDRYERLRKAINAANRGKAKEEDWAILRSAQYEGIVTVTGMYTSVTANQRLVIKPHYRLTDRAIDCQMRGIWPIGHM